MGVKRKSGIEMPLSERQISLSPSLADSQGRAERSNARMIADFNPDALAAIPTLFHSNAN
jgi:hypothetical protein